MCSCVLAGSYLFGTDIRFPFFLLAMPLFLSLLLVSLFFFEIISKELLSTPDEKMKDAAEDTPMIDTKG